MPPRRRQASDVEVDTQDPSYDGVPTVNVVVDEDPQPDVPADVPLDVVEVPALDDTAPDQTADQEDPS